MDWSDLKRTLAADGLLPNLFIAGLPSFGVSRTHDESWDNPYLPRHADLLLRDLAASCDRMSVYLKEWREMEIAAVKAATDRHVFLESEAPDKELIKEQLGKDLALKRAEFAEEVAKAFGTEDSVARGFGKDAQGRKAIAELEESKADRQLDNHEIKWQLAREVSDAYWARHQESGNAHNFAERASWAKRLLEEDGATALFKAEAISVGVRHLYGIDAPDLPSDASAHHFVEEMIIWTREMFRRLELEDARDQEFEFTVPLVQKILIGQKAPLEPTDLRNELASAANEGRLARFQFQFPTLPVDASRVRLRAVAVSFSTESDIKEESGIDRTAQRLSYAKLFGKLSLPAQQERGDPVGPTPCVLLGGIHTYNSNIPQYVSSRTIYNASCSGKWLLELHPLAIYQSDGLCNAFKDLASYRILDFRLHIKGICRP